MDISLTAFRSLLAKGWVKQLLIGALVSLPFVVFLVYLVAASLAAKSQSRKKEAVYRYQLSDLHEACHVKLIRERSKTESRWEPNFEELERHEKVCNSLQGRFLERVGAPRHELDYLRSLDGRHFDVDSDGKYSEEDYQLRNW